VRGEDLGRFPFVDVGVDLGVDEAAQRAAQRLVFVGELQGALSFMSAPRREAIAAAGIG
jgi:hypothetical protein